MEAKTGSWPRDIVLGVRVRAGCLMAGFSQQERSIVTVKTKQKAMTKQEKLF